MRYGSGLWLWSRLVCFDLIISLEVIALWWLDNNGIPPEILFLAFNISSCCSFRVAEPSSIGIVGVLKPYCITTTTFSTSFFFSPSSCWCTHLLSDNSCISSSPSSGPQSLKLLSVVWLYCTITYATVTTPTPCAITLINNSTCLLRLRNRLYYKERKSKYTYRYILECFLLLYIKYIPWYMLVMQHLQ